MKIYFAYSFRESHEDRVWCSQIIRELRHFGDVFTEGVDDGFIGATLGEKPKNVSVYERHAAWIKQADRVIAEVTVPSLEVGYEIAFAESLKKPILCLVRKKIGSILSPIIAGDSTLMIRQYESPMDIEMDIAYFLEH